MALKKKIEKIIEEILKDKGLLKTEYVYWEGDEPKQRVYPIKAHIVQNRIIGSEGIYVVPVKYDLSKAYGIKVPEEDLYLVNIETKETQEIDDSGSTIGYVKLELIPKEIAMTDGEAEIFYDLLTKERLFQKTQRWKLKKKIELK